MRYASALQSFDSALSIMCARAKLEVRADSLTRDWSAFRTFQELLTAEGDYRPSISRKYPETRELGALYDAAQQARGDSRRAFMFGNPARKGSIIDTANYVQADSWYRKGDRIAWWDRHTRQWIAYTVDGNGYQDGPCDLYRNATDLLRAEECHD